LIQERTRALRSRAEQAIVELIADISKAGAQGASDDQLIEPRQRHRESQFRADFVAADNSMGFHAAQESARILAEAIDLARQGQIALLKSTTR